MPDGGLLRAGRVGPPHGLDGSFRVIEAAPGLLKLGAAVRIGDREYAINRLAGHERRVILRVGGVSDRDGALALRGSELLVPRTAAPALEEDEWWAEDLEGCRVVDGSVEVGRVTALLGLPSCEALSVQRPGAGELLVPLVSDAVRTVDVAAKLIDIDLAFLGET